MRASFSILIALSGLMFAWQAGGATYTSKRPSDEERGEELYERHCLSCHGASAAGDGPATEALVKPVPDLRGRMSADGREAAVSVVLEGRGAMPSFAVSIDEHDARRVVRHLERLAADSGAEDAGP